MLATLSFSPFPHPLQKFTHISRRQLKSLDRIGDPNKEESEAMLVAKLEDHFDPDGPFQKKRSQQKKEAEEQLKPRECLSSISTTTF